MSEKNNILNKLLDDKKKTPSPVSGEEVRHGRNSHYHKIVTLRYKIYTIVMIIAIWIVWSSFLHSGINNHSRMQNTIASNESRIAGMTKKLHTYQSDKTYVQNIQQEKTKKAIKQCINFHEGCDELSDDIQSNLDILKAFFQIGNLYDSKMIIDEKSLLMNLDAFMTKRWVSGEPTIQNNGTIQELIIGDPEQIAQQLYQVPVDVTIQFPNSEDLLSFIENIEDKIIVDIDNGVFKSTPVLYRIKELAYDIVKYQESQETQIKMIAYYYKQTEKQETKEE